MREHLLDLAVMPPTRRQALSRLAREASMAAPGTCIAAALLPRLRLPAASAARLRTSPYSRACRNAAPWPLRPALRVVTE
ncbi:hypothetical protein [Xanthomonas sp. GW]|uniref:hypothetical protein n=1 Tax=Xanthomonas sp. GW TaxID=2724121 RepID=UPI001639DC7D|nr:hypothetical protein [Xanthomonas sp. GW]